MCEPQMPHGRPACVARKATNLSACDGGPLAVGDAVELQNLNAAPALNGKAGTVTVSAQIKCRGAFTY